MTELRYATSTFFCRFADDSCKQKASHGGTRSLRRLIVALFACLALPLSAWDGWPVPIVHDSTSRGDTLRYHLSLSAAASSGDYAPFWLHSLRNGLVSASPYSGNLTIGIDKKAALPYRWFDYDFALYLSQQWQQPTAALHPSLQYTTQAILAKAYVHVRLYVLDLQVGIAPEQYGIPHNSALFSTPLSAGGLLFGYNARPLPSVRIALEQWTPVPATWGYVEVKGGISHAWQYDDIYVQRCKVHHKWIGGRLGGSFPLKWSYEFHHLAQWGGYSPIYGDMGNDFPAFVNAFLVRSGGVMANDQINAQGNHIGSQIMTLEFDYRSWHTSAYWHNLSEDGPIRFIGAGMNPLDGLWGVHIAQSHFPFIQALTYEFTQTTDQSGPFHDKDGFIYGGADSYFTNSVYRNGWNYHLRTIGTPFITSPLYNADGYTQSTNTMVQAHFLGIEGDIFGYQYRLVGSHVRNFGQSQRIPQSQSINSSVLLEVHKRFEKAWGLDFSLALAADWGTQFGNSFGAMFTIRKQGIIRAW